MTSIEFSHLTKRYGAVTALDDFSVRIAGGRITAFLGANGSGKTTSMRTLLGLTDPNSGTATVDGQPYRRLRHPTRVVGAVLDQGFHPNRSARAHARIVAAQAGVPLARADDVLELVGLTDAARRRVGGFSLGMRQRLALACALVGDPSILVLDEPFNGLDPDGIRTMRVFLRGFADRGGTVFLSSHLLAEVAHSADDAVIIDRGRLVQAGPVADLATGPSAVVVTSLDADPLAVALARSGGGVQRTGPDQLTVTGLDPEAIGRTAVAVGAAITGMSRQSDDLESVFQNLIHPQALSAGAGRLSQKVTS
jgi:ABC-2 type transport system ATP-binding protein